LPGEIFVEIGMAIKHGSPMKHTFVGELANDNRGYIPTEKAFREGSYEVLNARGKPNTGQRLVETSVALLKKMEREHLD
jgi:hypothetical protein